VYSLLGFVQNYAELFLFHFVSTLIPKLNCVVCWYHYSGSGLNESAFAHFLESPFEIAALIHGRYWNGERASAQKLYCFTCEFVQCPMIR
jgi:hypothetical protein